jgi:uncharacterized protein (DUF1684 family)
MPPIPFRATVPLALLLALPAPEYVAKVEQFRREREKTLQADDGWVALAGLFFLKPGSNTFGSAPENDIRLPSGAPARAGVFLLEGETVRVQGEASANLRSHGAPVTVPQEMKPDTSGVRDVVTLGPLTLQVIKRGGRAAIRLWDNKSASRAAFKGLVWYPVDEAYRVTARFVPYVPPRTIKITSVLGYTQDMPCPGYVTFTLRGHDLRLEPVLEEPGAEELFFMLHDETSGSTTYGAGRFLYTSLPKDGAVILDFNEAYSPPCAFTRFATCPLPPPQNRLPLRIEAGEKAFGHH